MGYKFSAFGMSVNHPADYKLWINPNRPFYEEEGELRLDRMTDDKEGEVSLSIGWWSEKEEISNFAENFISEVDKQFKKLIKKGNYEFFEKELVEHMGHQAAYVYSGAIGSSHVFKAVGKKVQLQTLQLAWFCEKSKKTVIGTVIAPSHYVQAKYPELKEMLFSIECHSRDCIDMK